MIQRFSVENYGPFRKSAVLDMTPSSLKDSESCIFEDADGRRFLTSIGLFGMNASGKSYILRALSSLMAMMSFPSPAAMPILAYVPFRLSSDTKCAPVRMKLDFTCGKESFSYCLEYNSISIIKETLDHYPKGQRANVFKREGGKVTTPAGKFTEIHSITRFVGQNSTLIAMGAQFNIGILVDIVNCLKNIQIVNTDLQASLENVIQMANSDPWMRKKILEAMSIADFGIEDMRGKVDGMELRNSVPPQILGMAVASSSRVNQTTLHLVHHSDDTSLNADDRSFDYTVESSGTLRMIAVIGPVLQALRSGGTVLIDEFGAYLDHDICKWIVGLFKTVTNRNGAQLIFNTHDLMLIDTDELFRRDQIYLTDKDALTGEAEIYPISECHIRKDADVLKTYRAGKFGGRPYIVDPGLLDLS